MTASGPQHSGFGERVPSRGPGGKRGSALVLVMVFAVILSLTMGNLLRWALTEQRINTRHAVRIHSIYTAESVVEHGFSQLQERFQNRTSFPADTLDPDGSSPLTLPETAFFETEEISVVDMEIVGGVIPPGEWLFIDPTDPANETDPLAGMNVLAREVAVYGKATVEDSRATITSHATQRLQVRDAPLFANAIFYNLDLEIAPGADMEVHGTMHGNHNVYFQSGATLDFHDRVTSSADFIHGRHPGSGQTFSGGAVRALDGAGDLQSFQQGGQWLQSSLEDWRVLATSTWNGNVQSQSHGVQPHRPVAIDDYVPGEQNPAYELIQPPAQGGGPQVDPEVEAQKFSVKAGLRIRVNPAGGLNPPGGGGGPGANPIKAWTRDGTPVDIPAGLITTGSGHDMYDARRGKDLHMADFNVGKLKQLIENPDYGDENGYIDGFDPDDDWNGIVYVEAQNTSNTGIRLIDGSAIPSHGDEPGFTFATNNALYVQGHYNADGDPDTGDSRQFDNGDEPPAALIGDAVTLLSGNWDDSKSDNWNQRNTPSFTEISAAIMTGIVPSGSGEYSGGVENLPRFLENWSGRTLRIRGSMVVLYESEIATEPWSYGNPIYTAPHRDWGFHTLFQSGVYPPGTPNTRSYRRMHFRDITGEEYEERVAEILSEY